MNCPLCKLFIDELWTHWNKKTHGQNTIGLTFFHGCRWDSKEKEIIITSLSHSICYYIYSIKEACNITAEYSQ